MFVLLYIVILFVLLYIVILFVLLYIVNNSCYNIVTYCFGSYNIVQLSKINTSPCRPAPMGPNFQTHVYEPLGEPHGDLWAQGATFISDPECQYMYVYLSIYCNISTDVYARI